MSRFYWLSLALFALGLMAKPILVILPVILLVLDWWPLGRLGRRTGSVPMGRLLAEKWPFFLLALVVGALTIVAQRQGGAVSTLTDVPAGPRLANAAVSVTAYLWQTLWPVKLAFFYPFPEKPIPPSIVAGALLLSVGIILAAWLGRRRNPALLAGWLWYLAALLPVLGIMQTGMQARADRYTHLPHVGLAMGLVFALDAATRGRRSRAIIVATLPVLLLLGLLTQRQSLVWRDSGSLFAHAVQVTDGNWLAADNLGNHLAGQGRGAEALGWFDEALRARPGYVAARYNRAMTLEELGRNEEALAEYRRVLREDPAFVDAANNLGALLLAMNRPGEAVEPLLRAAAGRPGDAGPRFNLGLAAQALGDRREAARRFAEALALDPGHRGARAGLARAGAGMGAAAGEGSR